MATSLFTAGYAGYDPGSFLARLREYSVDTVIDVRRNPISRKRGFSRSKLAEFLEANDVQYVHLTALGVPRELRDDLRDGTLDLVEYLASFESYLGTQDNVLADLYTLATQSACCLLCVEHDAEECHRSVVANALVSRNGHRLKVEHI